jgi:hypothetical protein
LAVDHDAGRCRLAQLAATHGIEGVDALLERAERRRCRT